MCIWENQVPGINMAEEHMNEEHMNEEHMNEKHMNKKHIKQYRHLVGNFFNKAHEHAKAPQNQKKGIEKNALRELITLIRIFSKKRKKKMTEEEKQKVQEAIEVRKAELSELVSNLSNNQDYKNNLRQLIDQRNADGGISDELLKAAATKIYEEFPEKYYRSVPMVLAGEVLGGYSSTKYKERRLFVIEHGDEIRSCRQSQFSGQGSNLNSVMNITTSREQKSSDACPSAPSKSSVMELLDDYEF